MDTALHPEQSAASLEALAAYARFWLAMAWTVVDTVVRFTLALFVALKKTPFVFAAKRELFRVPFIGWHLRLAGYVEVDRDNRERAISAFAKAASQIRECGTIVAVYPEGTRSTDGTVLPFKKGPFLLALEAQVPIV